MIILDWAGSSFGMTSFVWSGGSIETAEDTSEPAGYSMGGNFAPLDAPMVPLDGGRSWAPMDGTPRDLDSRRRWHPL